MVWSKRDRQQQGAPHFDWAARNEPGSRFGLFHRDPHRVAGVFPVTILN